MLDIVSTRGRRSGRTAGQSQGPKGERRGRLTIARIRGHVARSGWVITNPAQKRLAAHRRCDALFERPYQFGTTLTQVLDSDLLSLFAEGLPNREQFLQARLSCHGFPS